MPLVERREVLVKKVGTHDVEGEGLDLFRRKHLEDQGQDAIHKKSDGLPVGGAERHEDAMGLQSRSKETYFPCRRGRRKRG
eukprot:scaffold170959_cov27-Tisochrysis_lutea.AAC.1